MHLNIRFVHISRKSRTSRKSNNYLGNTIIIILVISNFHIFKKKRIIRGNYVIDWGKAQKQKQIYKYRNKAHQRGAKKREKAKRGGCSVFLFLHQSTNLTFHPIHSRKPGEPPPRSLPPSNPVAIPPALGFLPSNPSQGKSI